MVFIFPKLRQPAIHHRRLAGQDQFPLMVAADHNILTVFKLCTRILYRMGQLMAAGHLEKDTVVGLLTYLGYQRCLGGREMEKTTQSGLNPRMREGQP